MRGIVAEKIAPYNKFIHKLERQMQRVEDMKSSRDALQKMDVSELVLCEIQVNMPEGICCSCPVPVGVLRTTISNRVQREQRILSEMLMLVQNIPTEEEDKKE